MSETKYLLEQLPNEPIIIGTFYSSFNIKDDVITFIDDVRQLFDNADQNFYYVNDTRDLKINVFQDMVVAVNVATHGVTDVLRHPGLKEYLIVATDTLIKLSARGLQSNAFGNINVRVFKTPEDALEYARSQN